MQVEGAYTKRCLCNCQWIALWLVLSIHHDVGPGIELRLLGFPATFYPVYHLAGPEVGFLFFGDMVALCNLDWLDM